PAGLEATAASRISLIRPAPATCVGAGVGDGIDTLALEECESSPPHPQSASPVRPNKTTTARRPIALKQRTLSPPLALYLPSLAAASPPGRAPAPLASPRPRVSPRRRGSNCTAGGE